MNTLTSQVTSSGEFLKPAKLAPIALFVYNRPEHTRRTVEALRKNEFAQLSDLFVFADAARSQAAAAGVQQVRKFVRGIEGFKSVTIVERERNFGLSESVINGVTQLCVAYGRMISVEDDVVTSPDFLSFINWALDRYVNEPAIFSICGFNYPIDIPHSYPYDAYFSYRFACWGWGTWKDRWQKADWSVSDYPQFIANQGRQKRFNRGGDDLTGMLALHVAGKVQGWDTVWAYTHSKHNAAALLPVVSRVYNVGLDSSGIHCRRAPFAQTALTSASGRAYCFPDRVEFDPHFVAEIHRLSHRSLLTKAAKYLLYKLGLI